MSQVFLQRKVRSRCTRPTDSARLGMAPRWPWAPQTNLSANAVTIHHTTPTPTTTLPRHPQHFLLQPLAVSPFAHPPPALIMPLEAQLMGFINECFEADDAGKVAKWLEGEKVLSAEGFGLLAASETEVQPNITDVALSAKAHTNGLSQKISFKKLWFLCRNEDKPSTGLTESAETALCEKARKNCEAIWLRRHNYVLAPGRRLVTTQLGPIHDMSHQRSPNPRDISMLPLRRMKLQDGSLGSQTSDQELHNNNAVFLKIRAFLCSNAFCNVDQPDFFSLGDAEAGVDKFLGYLYTHYPQGRPPVSHWAEAWEQTLRVWQIGIRGGKSLSELISHDSAYQHFWTSWQPAPRQDRGSTKGSSSSGSKIKDTRNKNGRSDGEGDSLQKLQQAKDRQIASLRRELEETKRGTKPGKDHQPQKRGRWGSWGR